VLILHPKNKSAQIPTVLIFGVGLIGSAIRSALIQKKLYIEEYVPFSWTNIENQKLSAKVIETKSFESFIINNTDNIIAIWSAGKAGFQSSQKEISLEILAFSTVLQIIDNLSNRFPVPKLGFYLISSAGGLFEGQRYIQPDSPLTIKRPYGNLKKIQEEMLYNFNKINEKRIFRLSSVYGNISNKMRMGLIPVLIYNGIMQKVTRIVGHSSTLRDFIWSNDVGKYIANMIMSNRPSSNVASTIILSSGKPSSIYEIQQIIEEIIGRKIYISLSLTPTNAEDITYSHSTLPNNWLSSDMKFSIKKIYYNWLQTIYR